MEIRSALGCRPAALLATLLIASCVQDAPPEPETSTEADAAAAPQRAVMTPARLDRLIHRIDQKARRQADNVWQFQVRNRTLIVVTDASADRMRVMTPIVDAAYLEPEIHERMLQANFDTALDARYAIGNGTLWGVFVHTLHDLTPELFLSAAGQVHNVAETFGKTYTSGALMFGTGDSGDLQRRLLEELQSLHQQST